MTRRRHRFRKRESGIFFPRNLDDPNHVEIAREISFCAQRVLRGFGRALSDRRQLICPTAGNGPFLLLPQVIFQMSLSQKLACLTDGVQSSALNRDVAASWASG